MRQLGFVLGAVDRGVRGGIDHDVRRDALDQRRERVRVGRRSSASHALPSGKHAVARGRRPPRPAARGCGAVRGRPGRCRRAAGSSCATVMRRRPAGAPAATSARNGAFASLSDSSGCADRPVDRECGIVPADAGVGGCVVGRGAQVGEHARVRSARRSRARSLPGSRNGACSRRSAPPRSSGRRSASRGGCRPRRPTPRLRAR